MSLYQLRWLAMMPMIGKAHLVNGRCRTSGSSHCMISTACLLELAGPINLAWAVHLFPASSSGGPEDNYSDLDDETKWLFGGNIYLTGQPDCFTEQEEQVSVDTLQLDEAERYMIDFKCSFPFSEIPEIIREGFEACQKTFVHGHQRILAHYETAHKCLAQSLGDPLCDLLLMIVLTLASSIVTPTLLSHKSHFEAGAREDPKLFAVTLTTRMLWFLHPEWFPWDTDENGILCIPDMIKKTGQCTISKKYTLYSLTQMLFRTQRSKQSNFVPAWMGYQFR